MKSGGLHLAILCLLASLSCGESADCISDSDCGDNACIAGACIVDASDVNNGECYPEASEVMSLGETLPAYSWSGGFTADGTELKVDLGDAPCGESSLWSPFDNLVFVSIPAW